MPDRAAIVTGASRGIGYALAEALGEEGYALTISARKPDTLEQAAAQLRDRGFEVESVAANLGDEAGVHEVVNLASIAGKSPQPWLSVYAATKAAVLAYTQAMNKELSSQGVKSVAFAPGFVDTDMTDYVKAKVPAEEMLRPSDMAEALRFLLRVSPMCLVPEVVFQRPQEIV